MTQLSGYIVANDLANVERLVRCRTPFDDRVDYLSFLVKNNKREMFDLLTTFGKVNIHANRNLVFDVARKIKDTYYIDRLNSLDKEPLMTVNLHHPLETQPKSLEVFKCTKSSVVSDYFDIPISLLINDKELDLKHELLFDNLLDFFDMKESLTSLDIVGKSKCANVKDLISELRMKNELSSESKTDAISSERFGRFVEIFGEKDWETYLLTTESISEEIGKVLNPSKQQVLNLFKRQDVSFLPNRDYLFKSGLTLEELCLASVEHNMQENLKYLVEEKGFRPRLIIKAVESLSYKCVSYLLGKSFDSQSELEEALKRAEMLEDDVMIEMIRDKISLALSSSMIEYSNSSKADSMYIPEPNPLNEWQKKMEAKHVLEQLLEKFEEEDFDYESIVKSIKKDKPSKEDKPPENQYDCDQSPV